MNWELVEFLLKGIYLGLVVMIAMEKPDWREVGIVSACTAIGLAISLCVAAFHKFREGFKIGGNWIGFFLFLLLEHPGMVYIGIVIGCWFGAKAIQPENADDYNLIPAIAGAGLGFVLYLLHRIPNQKNRKLLGFILAALLLAGGYALIEYYRTSGSDNSMDQFFKLGVLLLLSLPWFYLLTFAGLIEESEVEIAAICGVLGVGLWIVVHRHLPTINLIALGLPFLLYFFYTKRVLPGLRVFKHALRGLSYVKLGQNQLALVSLNRALQLDPNHTLAKQQLWDLHRRLDFTQIKDDPKVLGLINYRLCLERVSSLLLMDKPQAENLQEASHLLDLITAQRPDLEAQSQYWKTVLFTHQKKLEEAAGQLEALLRSTKDSPSRQEVLFPAWQLALVLHPELKRRVGQPLLKFPDRKLDAIAAVEKELAKNPDDPSAWDMKRSLYSELSEADYNTVVSAGRAAPHFDHPYVHQLGQALAEGPDQWKRGCEYLRIAARGIPAQAAPIYFQIAKTHYRIKDEDGMWANYRTGLQLGRAVGVQSLNDAERAALFTQIRQIGDLAVAKDQVDVALEAFKFYTQSGKDELFTYKTLSELFEKKGEVWLALHCTEHGLTYNSQEKDLLERKDRCYYSIEPADLKARWESVQAWFDTAYCLKKARSSIESYNGDFSLLDWAKHLADLVQVGKPSSLLTRFLRARIHRIKGEMPEAIQLLEEIRENKPEKFPSDEEEEAWFMGHRLLGELYLEIKPDQAVNCFLEFRKSNKSGADTSFKLGRAFENLGDFTRAGKMYEEVSLYPQHPLFYEAREGLDRVRKGQN